MFKLIFTSPSSAEDSNILKNYVQTQQGRIGLGPPKWPNNAEKHRMDGSVTPHAIAYTAVQVCNSKSHHTLLTYPRLQLHVALTDANHWMNYYNGFNYEEFYEFIVGFFEANTTPQAQEASEKLLRWWNR
jgi:hypothetical protein